MGRNVSKRIPIMVTLGMLAFTGVAWADAIRPPPKDCAEGSRGTSSHCGAECAPLPCNSDDDCKNNKVCRQTRLCVDAGERASCGRVPYKLRNKKYPYRVATGKCPEKGDCSKGTCVTAKRCVTAPAAPPPQPKVESKKPAPVKTAPAGAASTPPSKPRSSSWCQIGSSAGSPGLIILVLLALLLGRRRWRR